MLLREIREIYRRDLATRYPEAEIDSLFHRLVEHYLKLPRFTLALEPNKLLGREEEEPLLEALSRLVEGMPLQYITGTATFMGMDLRVGPGVLIPRPETEELVSWILERHSRSPRKPSILDIGTGSGCIALALARELPNARVWGMDNSVKALRIARRNASDLGLDVRFIKDDITRPEFSGPGFDLIVSNPPYVPREEAGGMAPHVRDHEPSAALFAPPGDPLWFYRHIVHFSIDYLRPSGWLYVETHHVHGRETFELFREHSLEEVYLKKDIFGKDRFVCGRKPASGL